MMLRAFWLGLLLVPLALAQSTTLLPEPRELPPCDDVPEPILFATLDAGIENLAFDGNGSLFLTAFDAGLFRATPEGTVVHVAADDRAASPLASPVDSVNAFMGVDLGPDGALYVAEGLSVVAPVEARVLRFPIAGAPEFEVYAEGFDGANGLAVTPDGVVFVMHGFRDSVFRITGPGEWEEWTKVVSGNGLVEHPDGERLVVAQIADASTSVIAIRLDDPSSREVLFTFNAPPPADEPGLLLLDRPLMTKAIDDLVVAPDGRIYASAHLRGQVLRGDPETNEACILLDFVPARGAGPVGGEPTSVRIADGFGAWDGWLFSVDNAGEVWAVDIRTPEQAAAQDERAAPPAGGTAETPAPWGIPLAGLLLGALARRR